MPTPINHHSKAYAVCSYIPVVSTFSGIALLFQKAHEFRMKSQGKLNVEVQQLSRANSKSWGFQNKYRIWIMMIPVIGNLILGIHDRTRPKTHKQPSTFDLETAVDVKELMSTRTSVSSQNAPLAFRNSLNMNSEVHRTQKKIQNNQKLAPLPYLSDEEAAEIISQRPLLRSTLVAQLSEFADAIECFCEGEEIEIEDPSKTISVYSLAAFNAYKAHQEEEALRQLKALREIIAKLSQSTIASPNEIDQENDSTTLDEQQEEVVVQESNQHVNFSKKEQKILDLKDAAKIDWALEHKNTFAGHFNCKVLSFFNENQKLLKDFESEISFCGSPTNYEDSKQSFMAVTEACNNLLPKYMNENGIFTSKPFHLIYDSILKTIDEINNLYRPKVHYAHVTALPKPTLATVATDMNVISDKSEDEFTEEAITYTIDNDDITTQMRQASGIIVKTLSNLNK